MVALVQAAPKQISVQPGCKDFTPEEWISLRFFTRVGFFKERVLTGAGFLKERFLIWVGFLKERCPGWISLTWWDPPPG